MIDNVLGNLFKVFFKFVLLLFFYREVYWKVSYDNSFNFMGIRKLWSFLIFMFSVLCLINMLCCIINIVYSRFLDIIWCYIYYISIYVLYVNIVSIF